MRRLLSLVACAVVVLSITGARAGEPPAAAPEHFGLSSARLTRIGQAFRSEIEKGKLPGAVVLVARKGRVAYFESFGVRNPATGAAMPRGTPSSASTR